MCGKDWPDCSRHPNQMSSAICWQSSLLLAGFRSLSLPNPPAGYRIPVSNRLPRVPALAQSTSAGVIGPGASDYFYCVLCFRPVTPEGLGIDSLWLQPVKNLLSDGNKIGVETDKIKVIGLDSEDRAEGEIFNPGFV